jgi:hypothetical protein
MAITTLLAFEVPLMNVFAPSRLGLVIMALEDSTRTWISNETTVVSQVYIGDSMGRWWISNKATVVLQVYISMDRWWIRDSMDRWLSNEMIVVLRVYVKDSMGRRLVKVFMILAV